jgi:RNA polymerase sigma factor (sigma-70 family)
MSVQIEGIGKQKINYRDHNEVDFYCLSEYLTLAKKSISKFANTFYNGLARKMLKDEDAISNVAYCLMLADWRYDEDYQNKHDRQKKTKYSYRNQCAIWAIQSYITKNYSKKNSSKNKVYSLDYKLDEENNNTSYDYIPDSKSTNPLVNILEKEEKIELRNFLDNLFEENSLSEKQKEYIKLYYYEDYTFQEIGKKFGLTREAIRQSIKKALLKIKETSYV